MAAPNLTFPPSDNEHMWSWQKADPKTSLKDLANPKRKTDDLAVSDSQDEPYSIITAAAGKCSLTLIESIHWFSFAVGFYVAGYVVVHSDKLIHLVGGDPMRLYLLVLGHLSQVFGGGITGNMMHLYEGWQVTPFHNPLALPDALKSLDGLDLDDPKLQLETCRKVLKETRDATKQVYVASYNNAWLRSVAYQLLFMFQAFGISCNTMAAFGVNWWTGACMASAVFFGLVGPRCPRIAPAFDWASNQPVSPLPVFLLVAFGVNLAANIPATVVLYGDAISKAWPPTAPLWAVLFGGAAFGLVLGSLDDINSVCNRRVPAWTVGGAVTGTLLYLVAHYLPLSGCCLKSLALLAPLGVGAGGIIEGLVAESSFNQLWHWRAFVVLLTGFGLYGLLYWHAVN